MELDLLPARMVNEYVYCPRLFYLEWGRGAVRGQRRHPDRPVRAPQGGHGDRRGAAAG